MSNESCNKKENFSLQQLQGVLESLEAQERLLWVAERFSGKIIATSSFGIQSAVCLKLISQLKESIPVVFIDTGYLFKETYIYAQQLKQFFQLDIHYYCPRITPAHQEALFGRLWEKGSEQLDEYLEFCKVEPMRRALAELKPAIWVSGLRREQADTRTSRSVIEKQGEIHKLYPIIDWSDTDVRDFICKHDLPRHPLEAEGYISVGDWHSTTKMGIGMRAQGVRFGGFRRECGLHDYTKWKGYRK